MKVEINIPDFSEEKFKKIIDRLKTAVLWSALAGGGGFAGDFLQGPTIEVDQYNKVITEITKRFDQMYNEALNEKNDEGC